MKEIWKDVDGYEGYYQVSNFGMVRSVDRIVEIVSDHKISKQFVAGRVLKISTSNSGYCLVTLCKGNKTRHFLVHRLVAYAFIDKPTNKHWINHIDNNPKNNMVSNLEWCTPKENSCHASTIGVLGAPQKQVWQIALDGQKIRLWDSATEAANFFGKYKRKSDISACCRNVRRTAFGYKWEFANMW